jgi:hypothetical protein
MPNKFNNLVIKLVDIYRDVNNYKDDESMGFEAVDDMLKEIENIINLYQGNKYP